MMMVHSLNIFMIAIDLSEVFLEASIFHRAIYSIFAIYRPILRIVWNMEIFNWSFLPFHRHIDFKTGIRDLLFHLQWISFIIHKFQVKEIVYWLAFYVSKVCLIVFKAADRIKLLDLENVEVWWYLVGFRI